MILSEFGYSNPLKNVEFRFVYKFDECDETQAAGKTIDLIERDNVDVIFGPTCNRRKKLPMF